PFKKGRRLMSGLLPFAAGPHPIWTPFSRKIHDAVWDSVGLEEVQESVRRWAQSYDHEGEAQATREHVKAAWERGMSGAEDIEALINSLGEPESTGQLLLPPWTQPGPACPDVELPLPPGHKSLSADERCAGLAAIHDVFFKGDKINPWPRPT